MKRTTVYFPDEMKAAIERQALRLGVTEAEVIRSAVSDAITRTERPKPTLPLFPEGLGEDIAGRTEEILEEMARLSADEYEQMTKDADERSDL